MYAISSNKGKLDNTRVRTDLKDVASAALIEDSLAVFKMPFLPLHAVVKILLRKATL